MIDRRLLDTLTEALARGEHPDDVSTLEALCREALVAAIIQDALVAHFTDTEIVAFVTELTEGRITCTRLVGGNPAAPQYSWHISPVSPCAGEPVPTWTLATWLINYRMEVAR